MTTSSNDLKKVPMIQENNLKRNRARDGSNSEDNQERMDICQ
jgi:hypothetical protein